jgi:hypothetical protein
MKRRAASAEIKVRWNLRFKLAQKLPTKYDSKLDAGKMPCRRTNRLFP